MLDLWEGTLTRAFRYLAADGRVLRVDQCRLVHMGDPRIAALRTIFVPEGWDGRIEVEAGLDGNVINANAHRYRALDRRHLAGVQASVAEPDTVWLRCRTRTSEIGIGMAQWAEVIGPAPAVSRSAAVGQRAVRHFELAVSDGQPATVVKTVALHTSRDWAISNPLGAAVERVGRAPDFDSLLHSHAIAWRHLWRRAELEVPGEAGHVLRLHHFHILQTLSPHTAGLDAGVPARGLHGEAYRGHVFRDELFVLPCLDLHFPEVARSLLNYRHRRLPRHSGPHVRRAGPVRCVRGRAATTAGTRASGCTSTRAPAAGCPTTPGSSGTSARPSRTSRTTSGKIDDNAYNDVTAAWVLTRALDLVRDLPDRRRQELVECGGLDIGELPQWEETSRRLSRCRSTKG